MSDKMKNLLTRTASGVVMLAVVLGATLYSPFTLMAMLAVVMVVGLWEFYALAERTGSAPMRVLGLAMGLAVFAAGIALVGPMAGLSLRAVALLKIFSQYFLLLALPMLFMVELFRFREQPMANIGVTLAGVVYVALPLAMLLFVPLAGGEWNPWMVLFFIFTIWANDVFAYLVGITLGRHRLCEKISPKKSWEGFFGGIVGALVMGFVAARVLDMSVAMWLGLALIAAVTGVLGDLVESMLKRRADVKDSGSIIPGHGGVLDRFDALLMATPFVCIYLAMWLYFQLL